VINATGTRDYYLVCRHRHYHTGGKDANQLIQKLGRGLRRAPDKDKVDFHDFVFWNNNILLAHSQARRAALENEGHPVVLEPPLLGNAEQELQSNTSATPALPPSS
jgi:superfamily II DNA or RNA helicase